jgi:dinuclear metal center YbgI/SA1388 family protein
MHTAQWVIEQFEEWSPQSCAEEWDNVGLLIGDASQSVKKILVALDATEDVVNEAISGGFDFIITHHPLIYNPIKRVATDDFIGRKIIALIKNGIGCYCAHTNLDKATGGVNDCLAEKIGLTNLSPLVEDGMGRVGFLSQKILFAEFCEKIKKSFCVDTIRFCGDEKKLVHKIGVCGGSGARYINNAIELGCDAYVTGDIGYHSAQDAIERGIALADITHYGGEIFILDEIVSRLKIAANNSFEIFTSSVNGQTFRL